MTDAERIAEALRHGALTGREISAATGLDSHRVSSVLDKYKDRQWVKLRGKRWGLLL